MGDRCGLPLVQTASPSAAFDVYSDKHYRDATMLNLHENRRFKENSCLCNISNWASDNYVVGISNYFYNGRLVSAPEHC